MSPHPYDGPGDGTLYENSLDEALGWEEHDRGFHDWCGIPPYGWCRDSDANIIQWFAGLPYVVRKDRIVNYMHLNPGASDDPYLQIDMANPLTIVARTYTQVGESIYKAGARTGKTQGAVTETCVDVIADWIPVPGILRCQHMASFGTDHGDSGAPVYTLTYYGDANLRGIVVGLHSGEAVFSPLSGIEDDFGPLQDIPGTYTPGGGGSGCGGDTDGDGKIEPC